MGPTMLRSVLTAFRRRYDYRRLIESDVSSLIQQYGSRALARALEYDAQGLVALYNGRREGHWRRVARCIAGRPLPTRPKVAFG